MEKIQIDHFEDIYWNLVHQLSGEKRKGKDCVKTILVVDDEPDTVFVLKTRLVHSGFKVVTAVDGEEAIKKVCEESPDLIILDLMLPGIGGEEVCKKLKENSITKDIPVMILSAKIGNAYTGADLECRAEGYFGKPYDSKVILNKIHDLLGPLREDVHPSSVKRILIIDDNEQDKKAMKIALHQIGLQEIYGAGNGQEAIEMVKLLKPDIVTLDIFLPDINGYFLCQRIKEMKDVSPIIIVVAGFNQAVEAYQQISHNIHCSFADIFLEKSSNYKTLQKVVKGLLF